jgi:hypothetical protein
MKITKERLKEIIEGELEEIIRPRMNVGSSGLRPSTTLGISPEAPSSTQDSSDSTDLRTKLMGMVMSYHKVSKSDPNVPSHVLRAFERLAQEIAKG